MIERGFARLMASSARRAMAARKKFDTGPAAETTRFASRGFLVLPRFTGVGFAAPKIIRPEEMMYMKSGRSTLPNGSRCRIGFRLILPRSRAVGSPNFRAE